MLVPRRQQHKKWLKYIRVIIPDTRGYEQMKFHNFLRISSMQNCGRFSIANCAWEYRIQCTRHLTSSQRGVFAYALPFTHSGVDMFSVSVRFRQRIECWRTTLATNRPCNLWTHRLRNALCGAYRVIKTLVAGCVFFVFVFMSVEAPNRAEAIFICFMVFICARWRRQQRQQ